jgi:uncharacterized membrane protein
MIETIVLVLVTVWLGSLALAIAAYSKVGRHDSRLAALKARIEGLETQVRELRRTAAVSSAIPEAVPPPAPEPSVEPAAAPGPALEKAQPIVQSPSARLEERLASRWLLWLGAAALALSGVFLINYAVERGLLTPAARIVLALLLGIALTFGGEWVRRYSLPSFVRVGSANMVAGALTSAGIFIAFASVYAAESLYSLISPLMTFLGLGIISLVAFALATVHAPIVAILGLLAGFLTPAAVSSDRPSIWGLFGYLSLIVIASLAVVRYRNWIWLAFGSIAGAGLWTVLWLTRGISQEDVIVLVAFQVLVAGAAVYLAKENIGAEAVEIWSGIGKITLVEWAAWGAIALASLLIAASIDAGGSNDLGLAQLGVVSGAAIYAGRRWQRFDGIIIFVAMTILLVFALKPLGAEIEAARQQVAGISGPPFQGLIGRAVWPHLLRALLFAFLLGMAGYVALAESRRPQLWAAVSTLAAALLLALTYARLRELSADRLWAMISTGAAILALAAATRLNEARGEQGYRLALGLYAAAVVAGVSFAFAFVFRNAWLTVALALQLPALAWLEEKLELKELRLLAFALASAVLIRLALNPYVLDYDATAELGAQWILYGYGVPAVAFFAASRLFRRSADDLAVTVLEAGALAFALLLVAFEIRLATEGRIKSPNLTFYELSLHTLVWLAAGWWRVRAFARSRRPIDAWNAGILITLGAVGVFIGQLAVLNPGFTGEVVGEWPLLNKLLMGYLAPAVLLVLIARDLGSIEGLQRWRLAGAVGALILAFTWITLETKHAFQGERLLAWHQSDAEYYAYSAVWLCFAFGLLAAGLWRGQAALRYGALAVLLVAVLKVFISDMAGLEGLYRVASFLGLGLSLVAIGWIYQRFVYPMAPPPAAESA